MNPKVRTTANKCQIEHSGISGKLGSQVDPTRLSLMQVSNIVSLRERGVASWLETLPLTQMTRTIIGSLPTFVHSLPVCACGVFSPSVCEIASACSSCMWPISNRLFECVLMVPSPLAGVTQKKIKNKKPHNEKILLIYTFSTLPTQEIQTSWKITFMNCTKEQREYSIILLKRLIVIRSTEILFLSVCQQKA